MHMGVSGRLNVLMFGVARKLTLRALGGSNTPRADAADAALVLDASTRVAAAARSGLIDLRFAPPRFDVSHFSALGFFVGPKRNINGP